MNIVSILLGVIALIVAIVGLVPFLGWLQWLVLVIGLIGVAVGAMSRHRGGMTFNIVVMAVAAFRLFIGGGIV